MHGTDRPGGKRGKDANTAEAPVHGHDRDAGRDTGAVIGLSGLPGRSLLVGQFVVDEGHQQATQDSDDPGHRIPEALQGDMKQES